jgi:hypothetical protein
MEDAIKDLNKDAAPIVDGPVANKKVAPPKKK